MEEQFETLESAHDFVALLVEIATETKRELEGDLQRESKTSRRLDALRIAAYKVEKLEFHLNRSRRILNDLRTLRRLLFEERESKKRDSAEVRDQTLASRLCSNSLTAEGHSGLTLRKSPAA